MPQYYPPAYYGALTGPRFPKVIEQLQNALYAHRVRRMEQLNGGRTGRVLDIGCGRGFLLRAFQRRGWEVQGTELSEGAAQYARVQLQLPVQTGSLEELRLAGDQFDAAVMWHVMEHVPNPRAIVVEVHRLLKPGGIFMVAVPDFGSPEARLARDKWFHLDVPRHVTHFTHETLRDALTAAGFQVRHRAGLAPEYDCFSFVQSALNRLGLRHNLLYHVLRARGAKVLPDGERSWLQVLLTFLLAPLLGVVSVPVTLLAGLLGRGATITLCAQKTSA